MSCAIDFKRNIPKALALAATLSALALGGCQSPMYSGTPDDMSYSYAVAPRSDASYVGRTEVGEEASGPADPSWTAEEKHEYLSLIHI